MQGHALHILTLKRAIPGVWQGIPVTHYALKRGNTPNIHPWLNDLESKVIRGEAAFYAAMQMKQLGFTPDVIVAHPGWGESLFLKEVWPAARLGIYCEFFYHAQGADVGFDPEFPLADPAIAGKLRIKNANTLLHFDIADAGLSPTYWQANTFPPAFRGKISVIHDGIDTETLAPNATVRLALSSVLTLTQADEIITFVNRDLEPYRGYHIFMRALPSLLKQRPRARILIVGGNGTSYGASPVGKQSWKDRFVDEARPQINATDWSRVHFVGRLPYDHLVALLQCSSVHVYLTYPFVLSWSLLEAMSIGCAIVASNTQPLHEAISDKETGLLVDFFDTQALADAIIALLDDPVERQRLGRNARQFAQANYDLQRVCLPRQMEWVNRLAEGAGALPAPLV